MLIVEDGTGLPDANSYASLADAARYYGLVGDDSWFGGEPVVATADLTITSQPAVTETLTIGSVVYTIVAALSDPCKANEVLLGADAIETRDNLLVAINQGMGRGTKYSNGTIRNPDAVVTVDGSGLMAQSVVPGPEGNKVVLGSTSAAMTWSAATMTGGTQVADPANQEAALISATRYIDARFGARFAGRPLCAAQALGFPRTGLPMCALGKTMPNRVVMACVDYAGRALGGNDLAPDPVMDPSGYAVQRTRNKLGPLEKEFGFATGPEGTLKPQAWRSYPIPDSLMSCLILGGLNASQGTTVR